MTDYINLENEEIIYYVYNLNWLLPRETQDEAIEILSKISPDKADMLIPKYGKKCWENGVFILRGMGYPRNKKSFTQIGKIIAR